MDWHGSIAAEVDRLSLGVDGSQFARAWRNEFKPSMARVPSGALGWTKIDDLHRMSLDEVLADFNTEMSDAASQDLNKVWHRLNGWPGKRAAPEPYLSSPPMKPGPCPVESATA